MRAGAEGEVAVCGPQWPLIDKPLNSAVSFPPFNAGNQRALYRIGTRDDSRTKQPRQAGDLECETVPVPLPEATV